ncbi:hypothetical protein DFH09DRAFT_1086556 [Mycena vulgaris]|nr:hypothetical protein DFH09DRAFT_1086556 [Mycena vulgaris]
MNAPPPQLRLSALTWSGYPKTWCAGDGDEHISTYAEAAAVRLNFVGPNADLGAIEYAPDAPTSFVYHISDTRAPWDIRPQDAAILGQKISSLMCKCRPGRHPWPERFMESDQLAGDVEPRSTAGGKLDSSRGVGWQGAWMVALLEKQARRESLGRREIIWSSEQNPTWAVEDRLDLVCPDFKAARVVECQDYEDERSEDEDEDGDTPTLPARGISDYEVRATVLRVFVMSEKNAQL